MTSPFLSHASPFLAQATPWTPPLPEPFAQPAQSVPDWEGTEAAEWRATALRCEDAQGRLEAELRELRSEWAGELEEVEGLARAAVQRSAELASTYTELRESCCETGSLFPAEHQRLLRLECLEQEIQRLGGSNVEMECLRADLVRAESERTRFEREAMQFRNEAEVLRGELARAQMILQNQNQTLGELNSANAQLDTMQLECADMRTAALDAELSKQHVTEELQEAIAEQCALRDEVQRLHSRQPVCLDNIAAIDPESPKISKEKKPTAPDPADVEIVHVRDVPREAACRLDDVVTGDVSTTSQQLDLSQSEGANAVLFPCQVAQGDVQSPELRRAGSARQNEGENCGFLPWGDPPDGGEKQTFFRTETPAECWPTSPNPLSEWTSVWDSGPPRGHKSDNKATKSRKSSLVDRQCSEEWPVNGGSTGKDRGKHVSESLSDALPLVFASVPAGGSQRQAHAVERGRPATRGRRREARGASARSSSSGSGGAWWDKPLAPGLADSAKKPLVGLASGRRVETGATADGAPQAGIANGSAKCAEFTRTNPFASAPLSRRNPFAD